MASPTTLSLHLPKELYREIANNLAPRLDRKSLLSLARVSTDWRHESQRILFSSVNSDCLAAQTAHTTFEFHVKFLQAVVSQPMRLGSYVRSYSQSNLACSPDAIATSHKIYWKSNIELWELTREALPIMINLKCLSFSPVGRHDGIVESLLSQCKFQLESLIWNCQEDSKEYLVVFLRSQPGLLHLQVGEPEDGKDISWLPDDVCPNLVSVESGHETINTLDRRRDVVAWKTDICWYATGDHLYHLSHVQRPSLRGLKYLGLSMDSQFGGIVARISPNIVLLELNCWNIETLRSLSGLPVLRVLVVLNNRVCRETGLQEEVALCCFRQLPNLDHILLRTEAPMRGGQYSFSRLSKSEALVKDDMQMVTTTVKLDSGYEAGTMWWTMYGPQ